MRKPLISAVLTTHREGLILGPTLKSIARSIALAERNRQPVELLVSLDRADALTRDVVMDFAERMETKIFENDFGDLSLSRNRCIENASGEFVAILDGDDLISNNWLSDAATNAGRDTRLTIWHPEVNVVFGEHNHMFRHIDTEDDEFDPLMLIATNPWTALSFARKACFEALPYTPIQLASGIGFEDWAWNREAVAAGYLHKVVKGTGHAIRRKAISLAKLTTQAKALPAPTEFFRAELEKRAALRASRDHRRIFLEPSLSVA